MTESTTHEPTTATPQETRRGPQLPEVAAGVAVIVVGLWLLADVTLGLDLPRVRWGDLWPVALIAVGAWVLVGALRRR